MRSKRRPTGDYRVGYCRPPEGSRFKKGQSGNPNGRRKKETNLVALFEAMMDELVNVQDGATVRKMSRAEAALRVIFQKMLKGDQKAMAMFLTLSKECGRIVNTEPARQGGVLVVPARAQSEEEFEALARAEELRVPPAPAKS